MEYLNLVWWNVGDFYHFDDSKLGMESRSRWPESLAEYNEKSLRVETALNSLFDHYGTPSIIALGEITYRAAKDLHERLLPDYRLISLDVKQDQPTLQVAVLYPKDSVEVKYEEQQPIVVPNTPRGTRPMLVLDIVTSKNILRCVICHWQARLAEESADTRYRIANFLSEYTYNFLHTKSKESKKKEKNIIIIGDLNEEPHELPQRILHAHRDRARSLAKLHWTDRDVKRVHLYNCSWRLIGEKHSHEPTNTSTLNIAGTYYWEAKKSWHQLDQLIVSGGLLGNIAPFLVESKVDVVSLKEFLPEQLPIKFSRFKNLYIGLSDHLPITASIKL